MVKALISIIVITLVAFLTNPEPEAHREKLKSEIAARSQLAALLRLGNLAAFVSEYHTFGLGSYITVNGRPVTYGAFGFVYVPDTSSVTASK
jgi:hypothetical protein